MKNDSVGLSPLRTGLENQNETEELKESTAASGPIPESHDEPKITRIRKPPTWMKDYVTRSGRTASQVIEATNQLRANTSGLDGMEHALREMQGILKEVLKLKQDDDDAEAEASSHELKSPL
ncbi:hypothetical protein PIB30_104815 [Stylosanthes scabra]|uniref:Uncharacterized protein n=1 Tax=Stylosanthes scabra TaxID=79078 RepID=A0ABU6UZ79_9FABA|nr:hypothetical protein [Stylosanthes scabra]